MHRLGKMHDKIPCQLGCCSKSSVTMTLLRAGCRPSMAHLALTDGRHAVEVILVAQARPGRTFQPLCVQLALAEGAQLLDASDVCDFVRRFLLS